MNSIKGYQLSDVDVIVANHINELPTSYVHVNRWFKHVTNQEDKPSEIAKLPKNVKSDLLAHFGSLFFLTSLTYFIYPRTTKLNGPHSESLC